jgi:hypothetical protein
VAQPIGALLGALTGRGDPELILSEALAIGSSSGAAMVEGVMCGAVAACGAPR